MPSQPGAEDDHPSGVSMAEVLATLSFTADLGFGLPMEHVMRSCRLAMRLGEQYGFDDDELRTTYYVALIALVGCTADSHEIAALFGDDIAIRGETYDFDFTGLPLLWFMLRNAGAGGGLLKRLTTTATILRSSGKVIEDALATNCASVIQLATSLGLGADVTANLEQSFTRFDGKGLPAGLGGHDLTPVIRVMHLADLAEIHDRRGGPDAALAVCRARAGGLLDPELVSLFESVGAGILRDLDAETTWDEVLAEDPSPWPLSDDELDTALACIGDYCDLKSPWFAGHSRGVSTLAARAAELAGSPPEDVRLIARAGSVHDLGRSGVPSSIWDKPGPLTSSETERVRLHAYYGDRMLQRPGALATIGAVAASNHERIDGSGYHRQASGRAIAPLGRILAAADAYHAMTEDRPHRRALPRDDAARTLRDEAGAGRFDAESVDHVLAAAGHPARRSMRPRVAELTKRELEVLVLIARGATTRQVAKALGISPKTAGNHIERLYTKAGCTSRATAALYAMQAGLLDSLAPYDPTAPMPLD